MITLETNQAAKTHKYAVMFQKVCIGNFANKKAATKLVNFLNWHQGRFGSFSDYTEASARLANAASQIGVNYIPGL